MWRRVDWQKISRVSKTCLWISDRQHAVKNSLPPWRQRQYVLTKRRKIFFRLYGVKYSSTQKTEANTVPHLRWGGGSMSVRTVDKFVRQYMASHLAHVQSTSCESQTQWHSSVSATFDSIQSAQLKQMVNLWKLFYAQKTKMCSSEWTDKRSGWKAGT
jgi:hypothetical protein